MTDGQTIEHRPASVPVQSLAVEVISGPDAGRGKTNVGKLSIGTSEANDLVLTDETVSRYHVELSHVDGRIQVRDLDSTNGTVIGRATLGTAFVEPNAVLKLGKTEIRVLDGETVPMELIAGESFSGVRGKTAAMRALMHKAERVAQTDASVLLQGETGTGKEVFARAIHESSLRAGGPFETVDCGSLHSSLIQSELFGHEPGAFTGANDRYIGAFERANGGTIFLDEIGELSSQLQPMLLGALERRSFRRVGGSEPIAVDVRVITATNRELREAINKGTFREDLYFRIGVVTLHLPALRERVGDIPMLIEHFARSAGHDIAFDELVEADEVDDLMQYAWPGNVRELRNFVEATLAMGEAPKLESNEDGEVSSNTGWSKLGLESLIRRPYKEARRLVLDEFEDLYFSAHLDRAGGNVAKAARNAEMNRSYLLDLLKRRGIR